MRLLSQNINTLQEACKTELCPFMAEQWHFSGNGTTQSLSRQSHMFWVAVVSLHDAWQGSGSFLTNTCSGLALCSSSTEGQYLLCMVQYKKEVSPPVSLRWAPVDSRSSLLIHFQSRGSETHWTVMSTCIRLGWQFRRNYGVRHDFPNMVRNHGYSTRARELRPYWLCRCSFVWPSG